MLFLKGTREKARLPVLTQFNTAPWRIYYYYYYYYYLIELQMGFYAVVVVLQ
jgi:hypothetical protein